MLIPNAFDIIQQASLKIIDLGVQSAELSSTPKQSRIISQLNECTKLFDIIMKHVILNDDENAIAGTVGQIDATINTLLLRLKRAAQITSFPAVPTPMHSFVSTNGSDSILPSPAAEGDILWFHNNVWTNLPRGADGTTLTSTATSIVWSAQVGNGIPSGGSTGQVLRKINNTSYNVAWASLTPADIGVSSSVAELNILDGATFSTAEANTLVGINTGLSIQAQLNTKASTVLNSGQFLVGNGSNVATAVTPTGDVTFNNAGLFAISAGVIIDADVSGSAAISRAKLASGNAYRVLINDNTGVMAEASAIAANRVIISNLNGIPVHSTITTTTLGFLDVSASIQTQLDARLTVTVTTPAQGDIVYYNGSGWVNFPRGTNGQVLTSTAGSIAWGSAAANGLPTGGTTNQILRKIDATNYNTEWHTFVLADVTDVVATNTEVNLLSGMTVAGTTLNFVDISSSLTTLLNNKQTISLPQNAIWRGNASNVAEAYPAGTEGYVLTVVAGVPTWAVTTPPGNVSGVAPSTDNALVRWNGIAADSIQNSAIIIDDSNNITGIASLSSGQIDILNQADLRLHETGSTNYVAIRATGVMAANYTITLPAAAPASNTFLMYDGANYVWNAGGGAGTIGGTIAATQVAFASGTDTIAGEAAFTYNSTDNILTVLGRYNSTLASDPVATVTNGDLFYSSNSSVLDYRARINGVWTNITRPGSSTKNSTYTISESERNYITPVDTSGGNVTIDISVDLSQNWAQTFINTGTNTVNFTASGGMTLNAIATTLSTQYGAVTLIRNGSNNYYAFGALGGGGGGGSGTVTSFSAGNLSPLFTSSVATATTTPALTFALSTQSANLVFAGPSSGGAATPTFRALVATDIPDLSSIYVTSVSGTTNRITVTGGVSPVVDIAATYVGQTSITTLGTIATGTWNATSIGLAKGGTNADLSATGGTSQYLKQSSSGAAITVGTIPASDIASGAALTKTDDTNVTLTLGGTPTTALLVASSLTLGWTGTLAYARFVNGAGLSIVGRSTNSSGVQADITGTTDQVLRVNGAGTSVGFGSIDLSKSATVGSSILGVANGGSGTSTVLTTGSVVFVGSSGVFTQNNSNFFWDNSGTGLALGTATITSGSRLDVRAISTSTSPAFRVANTSNLNMFEVRDNARVAIGSTVPTATHMQVRNSSSSTNIIDYRNSSDNSRWTLADAGTLVHAVLSGPTWTWSNGAPTCLTLAFTDSPIASTVHQAFSLGYNYTNSTTVNNSTSFYFRATGTINASTGSGSILGFIDYAPTETALTGVTHYFLRNQSTTALSVFGAATGNVTVDINGGFAIRQQTKTQITSNQNDYAIGSQTSFRMSSDASRNITGLTGGADGKVLVIRNVGSQNIVFTNEDGASTAANRITSSTGANITVLPNGSLVLVYDATSSRWFDIATR